MKAILAVIPPPPPPPPLNEVTITMTEEQARLLRDVSRLNCTIPDAMAGQGPEVKTLLNDLRATLDAALGRK